MSQKINHYARRKLHKLIAHTAGSHQDFIAQRCDEMLKERVINRPGMIAEESLNGLLLYTRMKKSIAEITGINFDQVPFSKIDCGLGFLTNSLPSAHYSMLLSNLNLDWLDAGEFIRFMDELLKPRGVFWISCYGALSARHTRSLLSAEDSHPHFNDFYELQDIGDALLGAGFESVVLESSLINLEYASVEALMADAERIFGMNLHAHRHKGLTPPSVLRGFKRRLAAVIAAEGTYTEQVEILIAHGRKPASPRLDGMIPVRQG